MISKMLFGANGVLQKGYAGYSDIAAFIFNRETAYTISATFGSGTENAGCNSSTKAYYGGGNAGSYNRIYDLIFSAKETSSLLSATLAVGRVALCALNSTTKGYWAGGYIPSPAAQSSEIDGIQFSNDTAVNPSATLSYPIIRNTASVCSSTRGYICGGTSTSLSPQTTKLIDYLTYSSETITNLGFVLTASSQGGAGVNSTTTGYVALGWVGSTDPLTSAPNASPRVDKLVFSTNTVSALGTNLSVGRMSLSGFNNAQKGIFTGGETQFLSGSTTTVEKLVFATETLSVVSTASLFRQYTTGTQSGGFL
jgi:hypothetical protein